MAGSGSEWPYQVRGSCSKLCLCLALFCSSPFFQCAHAVPRLSALFGPAAESGNRPDGANENAALGPAAQERKSYGVALSSFIGIAAEPPSKSSQDYAGAFTWNKPVGWLPPPWMPWSPQTWPSSTTVGSTHLTRPPPADPNTGIPLIGLNHVASIHRKVQKHGLGSGMITSLLSQMMTGSAGTGLVGSLFGQLFEVFDPDGLPSQTIITMASEFLDVVGGGLVGLPAFSLFKSLLGGIMEDGIESAVKLISGAAEVPNTNAVASVAGDMLSDLLGAVGGDELLGAPDTEGFISNLLAAGGSMVELGMETLVSSMADPDAVAQVAANGVQALLATLQNQAPAPTRPRPASSIMGNQAPGPTGLRPAVSLMQTSAGQEPSVPSERAQIRNLQAFGFGTGMLPTYADVYIRPGIRVGGEVIPAGRIGGWQYATDMRGPQPGTVTASGQWYPLPWGLYPSSFTPYGGTYANPYAATGSYYGGPYRRLGGSTAAPAAPALDARSHVKPEDFEKLPSEGLTSSTLAEASMQWDQGKTPVGVIMSNILQNIRPLIAPAAGSSSTQSASPAPDLFNQLIDVLAGSDELTAHPAWPKFKRRLSGLIDLWGKYFLTIVEPGATGVEGAHTVLTSFLDSVAKESDVLNQPQWKSFLQNVDSVLQGGAYLALRQVQDKIEDDPLKLAVGLETGINALLYRMVQNNSLTGKRFEQNGGQGESKPIAMVKLGKYFHMDVPNQLIPKDTNRSSELRLLRQL
eukprot:GHVT01024788.1.p1 GENE.GHVT01024788.1~~GHVT01024788.1.p1  ORF type:complete len:747 (-),score=60.25 GHVT01024788.1:1980-4220(-)